MAIIALLVCTSMTVPGSARAQAGLAESAQTASGLLESQGAAPPKADAKDAPPAEAKDAPPAPARGPASATGRDLLIVDGRDWGMLLAACALIIVGLTTRRLTRRSWTADPAAYSVFLATKGPDGAVPVPMGAEPVQDMTTQRMQKSA